MLTNLIHKHFVLTVVTLVTILLTVGYIQGGPREAFTSAAAPLITCLVLSVLYPSDEK